MGVTTRRLAQRPALMHLHRTHGDHPPGQLAALSQFGQQAPAVRVRPPEAGEQQIEAIIGCARQRRPYSTDGLYPVAEMHEVEHEHRPAVRVTLYQEDAQMAPFCQWVFFFDGCSRWEGEGRATRAGWPVGCRLVVQSGAQR